MKRKIFLLVPPMLSLMIQLLPTGAAFILISCGTYSGDTDRGYTKLYRRSFFDPFPIAWNGNFFPFLAGILTAAVLILTIIFLKKNKKRVLSPIAACSFSAALCAVVFPLAEIKTVFYGSFKPAEFNWYSIFIAACLIYEGVISILVSRSKKTKTY